MGACRRQCLLRQAERRPSQRQYTCAEAARRPAPPPAPAVARAYSRARTPSAAPTTGARPRHTSAGRQGRTSRFHAGGDSSAGRCVSGSRLRISSAARSEVLTDRSTGGAQEHQRHVGLSAHRLDLQMPLAVQAHSAHRCVGNLPRPHGTHHQGVTQQHHPAAADPMDERRVTEEHGENEQGSGRGEFPPLDLDSSAGIGR